MKRMPVRHVRRGSRPSAGRRQGELTSGSGHFSSLVARGTWLSRRGGRAPVRVWIGDPARSSYS
ncbi:hypothetical protein QJS66_02565 [Kocuria rhizophila]|nr:hypothetical protein QJS66_02565 [Kocuria rhizophila]